jgi:hypothetical protein
VEYVSAGPRRFAGLATAIGTASSISSLLAGLGTRVAGWDDWWSATIGPRVEDDSEWIRQLRRSFQQPQVPEVARTEPDDDVLTSELNWRAPHGTVGIFVSDRFGRSGWTVKLSEDVVEDIYFTVPVAVARAYAALTVAPDGRHIDAVFPPYLGAMRMLVEAATAMFGGRTTAPHSAP